MLLPVGIGASYAVGHDGKGNHETPVEGTERLAGTEARFDHFQVGAIACTALSDGGILAQRPAPPAREGEAPAPSPPPLLVPLSCLVVKMPQTGPTVLIDGGFGPSPERLSKPMQSAGRLLESLEAAGFEPKGIDVVLISHFDIDHVAGLYDGAGEQVSRTPNTTQARKR